MEKRYLCTLVCSNKAASVGPKPVVGRTISLVHVEADPREIEKYLSITLSSSSTEEQAAIMSSIHT